MGVDGSDHINAIALDIASEAIVRRGYLGEGAIYKFGELGVLACQTSDVRSANVYDISHCFV